MLTLIGIVLMLALAYNSYRSAHRAINGATVQENAAAARSAPGPGGDADGRVDGPESAAEAREAA